MLVSGQGGDAMFEYRNPEAILKSCCPIRTNESEHGHTLADDFEHFCDVTGCPKENGWAKLALAWAWTSQYRD
jgi:hypothetical protein